MRGWDTPHYLMSYLKMEESKKIKRKKGKREREGLCTTLLSNYATQNWEKEKDGKKSSLKKLSIGQQWRKCSMVNNGKDTLNRKRWKILKLKIGFIYVQKKR